MTAQEEYAARVQPEFNGFCADLITNYPNYNFGPLLAKLEIHDIISNDESHDVQAERSGTKKAQKLLRDTIPPKGPILHLKLIKILRLNQNNDLADNLDRRLKSINAPPATAPKPAPPEAVQAPNPGMDYAPRLPARDPIPDASRDTWSHTNASYQREAQSLTDVDQPDGVLQIRVGQNCELPTDRGVNIYYDMFGKSKGSALLINNHKFPPDEAGNSRDRLGSDTDRTNIRNLLSNLGYDIKDRHDLTAAEMVQEVTTFANDFSANNKSCIVVLMTHGKKGQFMGTDGQLVNQEAFFKPLAEIRKPKIFIIQACRGTLYNHGVDHTEGNDGNLQTSIKKSEQQSQQELKKKLPVGSETCILYSTTPGYFSWRNTDHGSWFIQSICQEFSENADKEWADLSTLGIRVTNRVRTTFRNNQYVQLPHIELNMTKKFHFLPGVVNGNGFLKD